MFFFFSSRRRHTRLQGDWSSDVCSSDLRGVPEMERLAKLVGQTTACGDVRLGAHPVAGLEQIDRAHPLHQTVEVGARGRRGEAIELVDDLAAPREAVGVLADLMLLHEAL